MTPLSERELELLRGARRAILATVAPDGSPRLVPITFVFGDNVLYTAIDQKPKSVADPRDLARVRDIEARPRVSVLVDEWSEDWSALGWLRLFGSAVLMSPDGESVPEHANAVRLLRAKYKQYATQELQTRPVIKVSVERAKSWFAS